MAGKTRKFLGRKIRLICGKFKQHLWGADYRSCIRCGAKNPRVESTRKRREKYHQEQSAAIGEIRDTQWHLDQIG